MLFLFCRKEIGMHKNTWPLRNAWLPNVMQTPIFGCRKRYDPHPICTNPTPLIIDRSLNTPHQRHYSSYLLISAFWGGVVKDRKAVFSPNYVHLKNFWGLMLLLVFLSAKLKLWNLILVVILCKLNSWPNSRFARCRHLTTTTRIPFDFSLLFKFWSPRGV